MTTLLLSVCLSSYAIHLRNDTMDFVDLGDRTKSVGEIYMDVILL